MLWLIIIAGYLLGSLPTGYLAGRLRRGIDVRQTGDSNTGAANVFRQVGHGTGIAVGLLDAGKGSLAIFLAQAAVLPQAAVLFAGAAAVIGHNWPVFLGFRGGRGESTSIGVLLAVLTAPMLVLASPALLTLVIRKNVVLASAVLFIPLPLVSWWLGAPGLLVGYSAVLPGLVGFTHFLRTRRRRDPETLPGADNCVDEAGSNC